MAADRPSVTVKRLAKGLVFRAQQFSRRRDLSRKLRVRTRALAKAGQLQTYPVDDQLPLVASYSFYRTSDRRWFDFFYSVHGRPSTDYVPLTTYYLVVEPLLNRYDVLWAVADKNAYDQRFPDVCTPHTPLRRIHGGFYDHEYTLVSPDADWLRAHLGPIDRVFVKPSLESGSGRGILCFDGDGVFLRSNATTLDSAFLQNYPDDFVVQEAVTQHPFYARLNPTSNNTLRVLTYRSVRTEDVHVLHTLLRIGTRGHFLDHDNHGGVAIAITKDHRLRPPAVDGNGIARADFNGVEFSRIGAVPHVAEAQKVAMRLAGRIHYGRLLAFDFSVNAAGNPVLLDINCHGNGVSQYQMSNGSLFNEFTAEVLDHCEANLHRLRNGT
jgi:hypothetical protein